MPDGHRDTEADRSSTDTVVPKGTLPGTAGATVIVALGQLFDDESLRRVFAVGGPALAGIGSTAWRWFAGPLERSLLIRTALKRIDKWLKDPDTTDEEKKELEEERQKLRMEYLQRIRRKIGGSDQTGSR